MSSNSFVNKLILFCVVVAIVFTRNVNQFLSSSDSTMIDLKLREQQISQKQYTTDKQQCPIGILDTETHKLQVNPQCKPLSELLKMKPFATNKLITFFLIYFNDHHHLAQQLDSWNKFSAKAREKIQFLIVDDGSAPGHTVQDFLVANYETAKNMDIVVYKIDQNLVWNIGGARNLGFYMANTPWVFMSDGDIRVEPETMDYVVSLTEKPNFDASANNVFVLFQRLRENKVTLKPHPAVMLLRKSDYWLVGGCDEDFVGNYGQTDPHFRYRVDQHPKLNSIKTHEIMGSKKDNVKPLLEMPDDISCPEGLTCLDSFKGEKPSRDTNPNVILLNKKIKKGDWTNEFLRFTWERVEWKKRSWFSLFW